MDTFMHLIAGLLGAIMLYYSINIGIPLLAIFVAWTVLIDPDHPIYFVINLKTLNPREIYSEMARLRNIMEPRLYIFHSPEFNLLLLILGFVNSVFWLVLAGSLLHIALDLAEHWTYHKNVSCNKAGSITRSIYLK